METKTIAANAITSTIFSRRTAKDLLEVPVTLVGCKPYEMSAKTMKELQAQGRDLAEIGERSALTVEYQEDGKTHRQVLIVFNSNFQNGIVPPASKFNKIEAILTFDMDPAKMYNGQPRIVDVDWDMEASSDKLLSHSKKVTQRVLSSSVQDE